jgi:urease accessory protein UreH
MTIVADRRESGEVGRAARLELVFASRRGHTVLAHAYAEPPFRAPRCFEEPGGLHMIMTSSAPGVFGDDALAQTISVEPGAHVRMTSQSATQLHPHPSGRPAAIKSHFVVGADASLHCDWHPLIPFAGAALAQCITVDLAATARLFWSDAMMSGRAGRGEHWCLRTLAHELRIARVGELEYLERYRICPAEGGVEERWVAADHAYFGTVVCSGAGIAAASGETLHRALAAISGVHAVDCLSDSLTVVRLMSASGIPFHEARTLIAATLDQRAVSHAV